MSFTTSFITCDREFSSALSALKSALSSGGGLPLAVNGLSGGAPLAFIAECLYAIRPTAPAPALIIERDEEAAAETAARLSELGIRALAYKPRNLVLHKISASHDSDRERLSVLWALLSGECETVVTTLSAALGYTMPREALRERAVSFALGDTLAPAALAERLLALGFSRVSTVDGAGQFASRGGIVDFWAEADKEPIRVEFFGDEIDRISSFDPLSQRSTGSLSSASLMPAREVVLDGESRERLCAFISREIREGNAMLSSDLALLKADAALPDIDKYLGVIYCEKENLLSYIGEGGATFILGTSEAREELSRANKLLISALDALRDGGLSSLGISDFSGGEGDFSTFTSRGCAVHINSFAGGVGTMQLGGLFGFRCRKTVSYGKNASMLLEDLAAYRKSLYRTVIFTDNERGAESLAETLMGEGVSPLLAYREGFDFEKMPEGAVALAVGRAQGYELIAPRIAVLSMARDEGSAVMANRRRQRVLRRVGGAGQRLMSHAELSVGDYVVHASYGIGLFEGIETVTVDGVTKDYIKIRYAGTDKLLVPCERLEVLGKYIGERASDGTVKLSKMGGGDWARTKARAKSAVKDIAKKLIALYAERQRLPGFAFAPDTDMEEEFASSFEYEETESQRIAIEEIKADMMRPVPMNRLLCGDVGFGKTEVALRAAFKAIMSGKQVAFLVPTTILAMQHYQTVLSRMRAYPVTVDMLSRFSTKKQEGAILRRAARGESDILIGTHKLLGSGVKFRDLGLLIIDEEQRFGVSQKERLKELCKSVDVLTLSATPIPRTLNMAMSGINDMSILDEAPGLRRPVQTYVLEYDEALITDALRRELNRSGQTIYLYNKVEDIDLVAARIMRAIPEARVAVAHGQMDKDELEDVWSLLVSGDIDVLVCTTIIETGVDLPNANTLIIENADRIGLAQLHQIRGRVGRSERQAYAYFTYRAGKALSEIAEKRLRAIREYAEFGAGFKIALEDLEIRGAGNLLGAEQHGYIESVGYDLYVRLLNEAVLEERGESARREVDAVIDIPVSANIPESYIPSQSLRMEMYKKVSLIQSEEDKRDIEDEFTDRFGDMPRQTERLVEVALIRALASRCGVSRVRYRDGSLSFAAERFDIAALSEAFASHPSLMLRQGDTPSLTYRLQRRQEPLTVANSIMSVYAAALADCPQKDKTESEE